MKRTKIKINLNLVTIFAIVFIFGGFMSIFSSILYYNQVKNAKYIQDTIGIVHSIRKQSDTTTYTEDKQLNHNGYIWTTQEEIVVKNGINFTYLGVYPKEPNHYEIEHRIISDDGINWIVNDSDGENVFFNSIVGIFCVVIGGFIFYMQQKRYI